MLNEPTDFLDALDDVFFGFDQSGTIVVWNQAAEDVTGYSSAELAGKEPSDFFGAEDAKRISAAVSDVFEQGEARIEADLVTADGERIPYEFTAQRTPGDDSVAFVGIGRDITARRRQQQRIERREQALREMYDIVADRRRTFAEKVQDLLTLGRAELGTSYGTLSRIDGDDYIFEFVGADDDMIDVGDVVPVSATNCEVAATQKETLVLGDLERDAPELTERAAFAEYGISCYIGAPVFNEDGVYGTFCFYDTEPRDGQFSEWEVTLVDLMSRWVSYELRHEQARESLERQNDRLEGFASVVSHDLRNPLNVIGGAIDTAQETGDLSYLEDARESVDRMETLIEDLLTLARSGDVVAETESVSLSSLCTQCWDGVSTDDATLSVESEVTVAADRSRLQQLLENLFRNAVEHGSTGSQNPEGSGDAAEHGGESVTVTVGDLPDGFYVEDDGEGIDEENRDTVFESGYSTSSDGTGFGLAIVSEVAEAHGWSVGLTEGSDGGARFEFTGPSVLTE